MKFPLVLKSQIIFFASNFIWDEMDFSSYVN